MQISTKKGEKLKILWTTNLPVQGYSFLKGQKPIHTQSWVVYLSELISKHCDLSIAFPCNEKNISYLKDPDKNITYIPIPNCQSSVYDYMSYFKELKSKNNFDVVHIWGSEGYHANAAVRVFEKSRTCLSIQGLLSIIVKHYASGIPVSVQCAGSIKDFRNKYSLLETQKKVGKRGEIEIDTLKNCLNFIGRTTWDKACSLQANPSAAYYFNNEILRKPFYENHWKLEKCKKHSIFMSQASQPFKGLHFMLQALPIIKKNFPDTLLYIAGNKINYESKGAISKIRQSAYMKYLEHLINTGDIKDRVIFTGTLNEKQMCERYMKSHVFVCPSSIENSPNSLGEAMILGVPCVASYVGGIPDMLIDKEEGFLYQSDAPYMLAHYVCEIFSDNELALKFSEKARKHAFKTHCQETNVKRLLDIYLQIAGK